MKLHRALRSDWSDITPQERNIWQRYAAVTHGVFTPANVVSVASAGLVIWGLTLLYRGELIGGCGAVIVGRLGDILDGLVAEYTHTKSPLGEFVDATLDKILIFLTLFVIIDKKLVPLIVGIAIALHSLYMVALTAYSRQKNAPMHPSRNGKLATASEWLSVGLFILIEILKKQNIDSSIVRDLSWISFGIFIVFAVVSIVGYTRYVYYKSKMRA